MRYMNALRVCGVAPTVDCVERGAVFSQGRVRRGNQTAGVIGYVEPTHPLVATPSAILAEMDGVKTEGATLNADITGYQSSDPQFQSFKTGWQWFWSTYLKFYSDNSGWFSRLSGSVADKTRDFGRQLNDWRSGFAKYPGAVATQPAPTKVPDREDPNALPWRSLAIGAVAVAGVVAGGYALGKVSGIWRRI